MSVGECLNSVIRPGREEDHEPPRYSDRDDERDTPRRRPSPYDDREDQRARDSDWSRRERFDSDEPRGDSGRNTDDGRRNDYRRDDRYGRRPERNVIPTAASGGRERRPAMPNAPAMKRRATRLAPRRNSAGLPVSERRRSRPNDCAKRPGFGKNRPGFRTGDRAGAPAGPKSGAAPGQNGGRQSAIPGEPLTVVPVAPAAAAPDKPTASAMPSWSTPEVTGSLPRPPVQQPAAPAPAPAAGTMGDKLPATIGGPALRAAALSGDPAAAYEIASR